MSMFEEFAVTWKGKEYVIQPSQVMGLIEVVEDHVTLEDMQGGIKRAKLSKAFLSILRYCGVRDVTQEEIYGVFFDNSQAETITNIITAIQMLMIPPEHLRSTMPVDDAKKKESQDS